MKSNQLLLLYKTTLLALLVITATGEPKDTQVRNRLIPNKEVKAQRRPILFEIERQEEILKMLDAVAPTTEEGPSLLPNRVYLVYSEEEKRWLWELTDFEGQFAIPAEALRTLSVLPGAIVGAKNSTLRYGLNLNKAHWVQTFQPEQQFFWVYSVPPEPPKIKTVVYKSLPTPEKPK